MREIYSITNIYTGRRYIGQSKNAILRFSQHLKLLQANKHYDTFQFDYHKYHVNSFRLKILEECKDVDARLLEQLYIDKYDTCKTETGYNLLASKRNSDINEPSSNSIIRQKISIAAKMRWTDKKYRSHMCQILKKVMSSDIVRTKISIAMLGKCHTLATRLKMSNSHQGLHHSRATRKKIKMSNQRIALKQPRMGIFNSFYGKTHSVKTREKIKQSLIKYYSK